MLRPFLFFLGSPQLLITLHKQGLPVLCLARAFLPLYIRIFPVSDDTFTGIDLCFPIAMGDALLLCAPKKGRATNPSQQLTPKYQVFTCDYSDVVDLKGPSWPQCCTALSTMGWNGLEHPSPTSGHRNPWVPDSSTMKLTPWAAEIDFSSEQPYSPQKYPFQLCFESHQTCCYKWSLKITGDAAK